MHPCTYLWTDVYEVCYVCRVRSRVIARGRCFQLHGEVDVSIVFTWLMPTTPHVHTLSFMSVAAFPALSSLPPSNSVSACASPVRARSKPPPRSSLYRGPRALQHCRMYIDDRIRARDILKGLAQSPMGSDAGTAEVTVDFHLCWGRWR